MGPLQRTTLRLTLLALIATAITAGSATWAQTSPPAKINKVWEYADKCLTRAKVDPDLFKVNFNCTVKTNGKPANELITTVDGVKQTTAFPAKCDYQPWLFHATGKCYGNTFVQEIPTGNKDAQAVLLCRHKKTWTSDPTKFDDIAMIVHNDDNGETCWFQTSDATGEIRDGTAVPGPVGVRDHKFWMTPKSTAAVTCVKCHDNGPWMNSTWMRKGFTIDDGTGLYVNNGDYFSDWPKPKYVTIARKDYPAFKGEPCHECHKIAAKQADFHTCDEWINFVTARSFPGRTTATHKTFDKANWMPEDHGENEADWKALYDTYVDKLITCCKAGGVGAGCSTWDPKKRTIAALTPNVQIEGSLDGGQSFPYYVSEPWQLNPYPFVVAAGSELTLRWGSPEPFNTCVMEATFPPGVSVNGISTASNWNLDDSYPYMTVGTLTEPGLYLFDLFCSKQGTRRGASMLFEVQGSPGYPPYLYLQTIVNNDPGDPATTNPGPEETEDSAYVGDEVELYWETSQVVTDSCEVNEVLRGEGSWHADYGQEPLSIYEAGDRRYVLTCTSLEGEMVDVEVTLHVEDRYQDTNLTLQAIVDGDPGDAATIHPGPEEAEDSATTSSEVYLTWTSENVEPDSCQVDEVLRGEGSWHAESGDEQLSFSDPGDRKYVLTCTGTDGDLYDVELTLHVTEEDAQTNLFLQAIVDGDPGDMASIDPGPESVEDEASPSSDVYISWSSVNVETDSCVLTEVLQGDGSWPYDWGYESVDVSDENDRKYVLTCTGVDGLEYEVDLLLSVSGGGIDPCDIYLDFPGPGGPGDKPEPCPIEIF